MLVPKNKYKEAKQVARYTKKDHVSNEFFQLPKFLFNDELKGLNSDSRMLYAILKDRHGLSIKNNWVDKRGCIFMHCGRLEMSEMLNLNEKTVKKAFDLLKEHKLIEEVRQGQGKPNMIYLLKPSFATENDTGQDDGSGAEDTEQETQNDTNQEVENNTDQEGQNVPFKNRKFYGSKTEDITVPEPNNLPPNNTYFSNTDLSDINSINQSNNLNTKSDGLIELETELNLNISSNFEALVLSAILQEGTLPYEYVLEHNKMSAAIKLLTEFENYKLNAEIDSECQFEFSVVSLFVDALTEMLTTNRTMELKGAHVTNVKVYEKLIPYIEFDGANPSLYGLLEATKRDYMIACKRTQIQNYLGYMKSCIWTSLQNNNIDLHAFNERLKISN